MWSSASSLTESRSPSPEPTVQPDHFYGADSSQLPSPDSEGKTYLSPSDDPLAHRGIPVFKPTMDEFSDFEGYMSRVECWGRCSGIIKVVPPKEWTDARPDIKPQLARVKIKSPIEQFMRGGGGLFRQENMEKRKAMSVREWAELCSKDEFRAPGVEQVGLHKNHSAQTPLPSRRKKPKEKDNLEVQTAAGVPIASPPNSTIPDHPEDAKPDDSKPRNRRAERADKDVSFLETFSPHTDWLPPDTTAADYTPEFCNKLERTFWRNCGIGKPPWYGADTMGSLFTDATTAWNVAHLPSTLSRLLPRSQGLPGVNTPYLYFGMWRATFAWHVEDMDLFSINYIHFGAPKFWYAVPQARAGALEGTMRGYFPKDTSVCPQFLRHKSFLASPTLLAQSAVRPNHLVQHAGEFVITYPRGYHAGFNLGFNCAESVNFALDSWLDEGRTAAVCKCVDYSVRIDVDQLLEDRRLEALEKTDPKAAALERATRNGVDLDANITAEHGPQSEIVPLPHAKPPSPRKRKPTIPFEPTGIAKRPRTALTPSVLSSTHAVPSTSIPAPASTFAHMNHAGPKLTLKLGPRPASTEKSFPCCLCVDPSTNGLARVHDLPAMWREVCPAARMQHPAGSSSKGMWMAHETCANVLPETWVDEIAGERVVFGVDSIVRGRWSLKCSVCTQNRSKDHGALIQCTKGKCPKSFHINCARDGHETGISYTVLREIEKEVVLLEPSSVPDLHVLKVIKKVEFEALCPQHNPVLVAGRRASRLDARRADLLALQPLSRIKIRVSAGVFEVTLIRVLEEKRSVEVLWDLSEVREVRWSSIILDATSQKADSRPIHKASVVPSMGRPQAIAPYHHLQNPDAKPTEVPNLPTGASSTQRHPANTNFSTSTSANNVLTTNPTDTPKSNSATTQNHNPYSALKYEYWPYTDGTCGATSSNSAKESIDNNPDTSILSTSALEAASQHVPGTHYVTQYYTGPQPWSSQYYRPKAYYSQTKSTYVPPGQRGVPDTDAPLSTADPDPSQTSVPSPSTFTVSTSASSVPDPMQVGVRDP